MPPDEATTTDQSGIARTVDGTITDQGQSSQTTTQQTQTTQQTSAEPATLLSEPKTEGKTEEKTEAKPGVPEKYEDYKVPDGYVMDAEAKGRADEIFKGLGLNQEQAQSLVDFYVKETTEALNAPYAAYTEMKNAWRDEALAHPDLAGKIGPGKEVNVRIAKALDSLGDPKLASDFREAMDLTGVGNHHSFIRVMDRLAQRLTEGTHVAGKGPSQAGQSRPGEAPPSAAGAIWPNLPAAR